MQTPSASYHSVITADIVSSQTLASNDYEQLITQLKLYLTALRADFGAVFHIFRGDSFQVAFKEANTLFKHAISLRLFFLQKGLDVKVSLAKGEIMLSQGTLATATGKALVKAGRGLDNIKQQRLVYNNTCDSSFLLNIKFIDLLLGKLSSKQAQALLLYLQQDKPEHALLAEQLNTSRANVTKLLNLANYTLIDEFITLSTSHTFSKET
jgi:hypothetical protein